MFFSVTDAFVVTFLQKWTSALQCQMCHMTFSDQSAISAHYTTAHSHNIRTPRAKRGTGTNECEVCGKRYMGRDKLKMHMADVHGIGELKTFQCEFCPKVFKQKSHLQAHLKRKHE